jgi:tRNA modification GTPase
MYSAVTASIRVAELTSSSPGAIAVIRIRGPGALALADSIFEPAQPPRLAVSPARRPRVGYAGDSLRDQILAVPLGPSDVEIHTHGGPRPVQLVLDALRSRGAVVVTAEALGQTSDSSDSVLSARAALPVSTTDRVAQILLDQLGGAFDEELREVHERLVRGDLTGAYADLKALSHRSSWGVRLLTGWTIALAGRPNSGKSSLLNALLGYERALVDHAPGTTRDPLKARAALDGWPVELIDTAGLREIDDPLESEGVLLAARSHRESDVLLLVLDRALPLEGEAKRLLTKYPNAIRVASKSDLTPAWDNERIDAIGVSALSGHGLDRLVEVIVSRLVPESNKPGAGVAITEAIAEKLALACHALGAREAESARLIIADLLGDARNSRADALPSVTDPRQAEAGGSVSDPHRGPSRD